MQSVVCLSQQSNFKGSEDVGTFVCYMVRKPAENDFDRVKKLFGRYWGRFQNILGQNLVKIEVQNQGMKGFLP